MINQACFQQIDDETVNNAGLMVQYKLRAENAERDLRDIESIYRGRIQVSNEIFGDFWYMSQEIIRRDKEIRRNKILIKQLEAQCRKKDDRIKNLREAIKRKTCGFFKWLQRRKKL